MNARPIVRDSDILDGKWRFDGTLISVMDLRRDFEAGGESVRDSYRAMGLTDAEIDNAFAFDSSATDTVQVQAPFVRVLIRCVCGYRRHAVAAPPDYETTPCVCERRWRIPVTIEPAPAGATSADSV